MTIVSRLTRLGRPMCHVKFSAHKALSTPKTSQPKGLSGLWDSSLAFVGLRYDARTKQARLALLRGDERTYSALKREFNREGKRLNLSGLNLVGKDITWFDLSNTNLSKTVLDPQLPIPGLSYGQLREAGFEPTENCDAVFGYRTQRVMFMRPHYQEYVPGQTYTAPWFSRDTSSPNHPGLYLFPTIEAARQDYPNQPLVQVKVPLGEAKASNILRAKLQFRTPTFEVVKNV
jgi:hypothetical protein